MPTLNQIQQQMKEVNVTDTFGTKKRNKVFTRSFEGR